VENIGNFGNMKNIEKGQVWRSKIWENIGKVNGNFGKILT